MLGTLSPHSLFCLEPPYDKLRPIYSLAAFRPPRPSPPWLLLLDAQDASPVWPSLAEAVQLVRSRFPQFALTLRATPVELIKLEQPPQRLASLHLRAILSTEEPLDALRPQLLDSRLLGHAVMESVCTGRPRLAAEVASVLEQWFDGDQPLSTPAAAFAEHGISLRTVERALHQAGLPPPKDWLQFAKSLRATLRIQGSADPVLQISLDLGYADQSALSHQILRVFGLRPSEFRGTLSWDWLLDRWLTKRIN